MITSPEEYLAKLGQIQDENKKYLILNLPTSETIYNIDLNKRTIAAPQFLSVLTDHQSETIYFRFDRYYDNQDLSETTALVIFKSKADPQKKTWAYAVPFMDIFTEGVQDKVLIPWVIGGAACRYSGEIEFSLMFYQVDENNNLLYRLNTQPAKSQILHGMDTDEFLVNEEYFDIVNEYEALMTRINAVEKQSDIFWIEAY